MEAPEAQDLSVPDGAGSRKLKFTGYLLSEASSARKGAPRWTVLRLYKTVGNIYVIHRVGESRVFHSADCPQAIQNRLPYGHELHAVLPPWRELTPCPTCAPQRTDEIPNLRFEQPRNWANVVETAQGVVDSLYRTEKGSRNLPWLASTLLSEAARIDKPIDDAYSAVTL
jgi:hypothetical protein